MEIHKSSSPTIHQSKCMDKQHQSQVYSGGASQLPRWCCSKKISDFLCKGIRHYTENNANSSVKISRRQKHCFLFFKTITVLTLKKKREKVSITAKQNSHRVKDQKMEQKLFMITQDLTAGLCTVNLTQTLGEGNEHQHEDNLHNWCIVDFSSP